MDGAYVIARFSGSHDASRLNFHFRCMDLILIEMSLSILTALHRFALSEQMMLLGLDSPDNVRLTRVDTILCLHNAGTALEWLSDYEEDPEIRFEDALPVSYLVEGLRGIRPQALTMHRGADDAPNC